MTQQKPDWWCEAALATAYKKVRRNGGMAGRDGVSAQDYAGGLEARLRRLSTQLKQGRLVLQPHLLLYKTKTDGRKRRIAIPAVVDRVWQTALAEALAQAWEPTMAACSFAYRPGRSVEDAVLRATLHRLRGFTHVAHADIANFFDSIRHADVKALLARGFACPVAQRMTGLWLAKFGRDTGLAGIGIPQGSPLSPIMSNHVLTDFDRAFESQKKWRYLRYADNLLFMAKDAGSLHVAMAHAETALHLLGLRINRQKSQVANLARSGGEPITFLGYALDGDRVRSTAACS